MDGKYIVAVENAHGNKMVNCIKVSNAFADGIIIITAGEDETVKIWDIKFNKINEISIRKLKFYSHIGKPKKIEEAKNLSPQSIDIYFCND